MKNLRKNSHFSLKNSEELRKMKEEKKKIKLWMATCKVQELEKKDLLYFKNIMI